MDMPIYKSKGFHVFYTEFVEILLLLLDENLNMSFED